MKVPQTITHDKVLVDCDEEFSEFLETMDILGPKLGPIVFQFPLFQPNVLRDRHEFTDRLIPFLKKLPDRKFAIEIRNQPWLDAEFADLLRDHGIALVLQDRSWMPDPLSLRKLHMPTGWVTIEEVIRFLIHELKVKAKSAEWDRHLRESEDKFRLWTARSEG